jgi:hypothetical protein
MILATALVPVTRGSDGCHVISRSAGQSVAVLTDKQYADLGLPGAGAPPGITKDEWDSGAVFAAGGVPDYGNGLLGRLRHGEIAESAMGFELGVTVPAGPFAGRVAAVKIPNEDVTISRVGGLTLTPKTAWPAGLGIISIIAAVLSVDDGK